LTDRAEDMKGYDDARRALQNAIEFHEIKTPHMFEALLEKIIADARSNLQNNGSVVRGQLLASIKILDRLGDLDAVVGSDLEYAYWVENGRGIVEPVNAKVLHWVDKVTGEDVFAMRSGPSEPMPFLEPAVIENTEPFPEIVVTAWSDAANSARSLR